VKALLVTGKKYYVNKGDLTMKENMIEGKSNKPDTINLDADQDPLQADMKMNRTIA